jgi:hypothetical protein
MMRSFAPHALMEVLMRTVVLEIPRQDYPEFCEHLKSWERATGEDARWTLGDAANPMTTTNSASPITLTCQLDDTFFEQFPEWEKYVTR